MPEQHDSSLMIGEIRGQLREMVHSVNNLSMKFDGLAREVTALALLAGEMGTLKAKVEMLEGDRNRRDGATGLLTIILKSPAIGWIVGAAVTAWAILTGRVHV